VVQWLACWTSDLKVGGSRPSPCHCVVSSDKTLYPTLSLSTQVYKMGTGDILLGVTPRWTSIPSGGKQQYSQLLHATETGLSPALWASLARARLYLFVTFYICNTSIFKRKCNSHDGQKCVSTCNSFTTRISVSDDSYIH